MPHIRFRAITSDQAKKLSQDLLPILATAIPAKEDTFTFELVNTEFFSKGEKSEAYPQVEVNWFERPQELQDQVAKIITDQVKALTKAEDILVTFNILTRTAYYDNGTHY